MFTILQKRTLSRGVEVAFSLGAVVSIAGLALVRGASAASSCSWSIVSSPNTGMRFNILRSVAVVAANDVWAVGSATRNEENPGQTLIEHWNGTAWAIVPSPRVAASSLDGVAENSSTDVWAVGQAGGKTLTEHWNGRRWQVIPSPSKPVVNGQRQ